MKSLQNMTIWVTGASSGLGRSLAIKLAELGNTVIISARGEEKLQEIQERFPDNVKVFACDVSEASSLAELGTRCERLDLVIACAGTCEYDDKPSFDEAMYRRVFDVNFFGSLNTLRAAMPLLKLSALKPRFAFVGSLSSIAPFPRAEAYGASKAAVDYLAETSMIDLARHNIAVSLVRPGFVDTPLTQKNDFPMPFMLQSDDAASRLIKGLEKEKAIIDFPTRLSFTIKLLGSIRILWRRVIAPSMARSM